MERAVADRAIAEEGNGDLARFLQHIAVARARRHQNARPDDAARAQHANLGLEDVHTAAASVRATRHLAEQFGDHLARRHALGERVAVAAMRAHHRVALAQVRADRRRDRLLTDVRMACAGDEPGLMQPRQLLLAATNLQHLPIEAKHLVFTDLRLRRLCRLNRHTNRPS